MRWLERHWYRITPLSFLLVPVSLVFLAAVALRRALYRIGLLRVIRIPVPVIVVGNITAGGTGKTPLVAWLVGFLRAHGMRPGVVSRGYGGRHRTPAAVAAGGDAGSFGDEAVLLARICEGPVWIGHDRAATARALIGLAREDDMVRIDDVERLRVDSSRASLTVSIDGETCRMKPPLDYRIRKGALRVRAAAPKEATRRSGSKL